MEVLPKGELYPEVREFVKGLIEQRIAGKTIAHALAYISTEFALHCADDPLEACSDILAAIHTATEHHRNLISVNVDEDDDGGEPENDAGEGASGAGEMIGVLGGEGSVH